MATKSKTTGTYYSRDAAARILAKHLGNYGWHKELMRTAERTKEHQGYKGAGILLIPCCLHQGRPHYSMPEIMRFVADMRRAFPELGPSSIKGVRLRVPVTDQRDTFGRHGFRLNLAEKA